ncbi:MAG: helix-turn-helix domain-containing protein, partial [Bacilli bacterium]
SKGDWASLLGMKRETLSRKLRYFKENGYINLKGQRIIYILDRAYFEKLAKL